MRNTKQSKGRECIYPEVPRVYHAGSKGTFMDMKTHLQYFEKISYNRDTSVRWDGADGANAVLLALQANYHARLEGVFRNPATIHVANGAELALPAGFGNVEDPGRARVLWYSADPDPQQEHNVRPLTQHVIDACLLLCHSP